MWRCLIIEDDADNARYLANALLQAGHTAIVCNDGISGLQQAVEGTWNVIILDRMLPGDVDGLAILSTMRSLGKKTPVLVLSALSGLDERVRGLKAGGDDYLTKPFALPELMARIEALVRRASPAGEQRQLQLADLSVDLVTRQVQRADRPIALQPREFRLLAYLMTHPDQLMTRSMLLAAVWGFNFDPQTNVIDVQISRLRQKIDGPFQLPLIHTVRGAGYVLSASPPNLRARPDDTP